MPDRDPYLIRELRLGDRHDAERLADMWNRSDEGWPGGWTGGVPVTAERVLREDMQWDCYAQWVAEHGGEIVGYIAMLADPSQPQSAYVALLNARPDHHGKGVGKRLLRRAVDAAIEGGFEELGIYTWPGNLKAVPLYKKMGSFWSPDTGVYLQNFVPTILRMPLLEDFFRDRDWYATQERDLAVAEDLERWHGVRVYRYRFAAEGERIEILIDRLARMPTALETGALSLAAWVGAEELAALREHTLHYEFRNKAERPVAVGLVARGEGGVPFVLEESFELKGRRRMSVPFRLPADLERKAPGEPPHRVLSTVTVGGVPVRLGTAVRKRDPVEVDLDGGGFAAGRPAEVRIRLRNRLPFPASGVLRVGAPPGLERLEENLAFRIPRRGWSGASLRVRA
ncbi:MAG: GNAT family N-acetyltransferase, partial [Planctomycetota bacterium]